MYGMSAQLKGISMQLSTVGIQSTVMEAMKNSSGVMQKAAESMNISDM